MPPKRKGRPKKSSDDESMSSTTSEDDEIQSKSMKTTWPRDLQPLRRKFTLFLANARRKMSKNSLCMIPQQPSLENIPWLQQQKANFTRNALLVKAEFDMFCDAVDDKQTPLEEAKQGLLSLNEKWIQEFDIALVILFDEKDGPWSEIKAFNEIDFRIFSPLLRQNEKDLDPERHAAIESIGSYFRNALNAIRASEKDELQGKDVEMTELVFMAYGNNQQTYHCDFTSESQHDKNATATANPPPPTLSKWYGSAIYHFKSSTNCRWGPTLTWKSTTRAVRPARTEVIPQGFTLFFGGDLIHAGGKNGETRKEYKLWRENMSQNEAAQLQHVEACVAANVMPSNSVFTADDLLDCPPFIRLHAYFDRNDIATCRVTNSITLDDDGPPSRSTAGMRKHRQRKATCNQNRQDLLRIVDYLDSLAAP